MAFLISDIRQQHPEEGRLYFFDANVWLAVLESPFYNEKNSYRPYVSFFNAIISQTTGKAPKIALPAVLISEIINRILRDIYYVEYLDTLQLPDAEKHNHPYKEYRNSNKYKADLKLILGSIRQYHNRIVFVSDDFNQYTSKQVLKNLPTHLDYNDYLYTLIAKKQNLVIVTNDADFAVEDVPVYTTRGKLIALNNK